MHQSPSVAGPQQSNSSTGFSLISVWNGFWNFITWPTRKIGKWVESLFIMKVAAKADRYGDADDGVEGRGKTGCGGLCSLIFIGVFLVVLALNIVRIAAKEVVLENGDGFAMHPNRKDFKIRGIIDVPQQLGQYMHVPVMIMNIANDLYLFESENPSIQKIAVVDNTQYNPNYATMTSDPPTMKSVYSELTVPFDSVDDDTGFMPGRFPSTTLNSNNLYFEQLPGQFSQALQTIELLNAQDILLNTSFFPHKTHLYVRFDRDQLSELLDNQLDVVMYNNAERKSKTGNHESIVSQLTTLVSDPSTWKITSMDSSFNVLTLESTMSSPVVANESPLNWQLKVQYSANFNYTVDDFFCYSPTTNLTKVPFTPIAWATAPSSNGTTITLMSDSLLIANFGLTPPFDIVIWDRIEAEKVTVTAINENVLTIKRTDTYDFAGSVRDPNCFWYNDMPFLASMPIPADWDCPPEYFNDMECDCFCGAVDIDCAFCQQDPDNNYYEGYCNYKATNTSTPIEPVVAVGLPCSVGGVRWPGDSVTRGFYSSPSKVQAKQCPEDSYYGGSAVYFQNGSLWCNAKPEAQVIDHPTHGTYVYQALSPLLYETDYRASLTIGKYSFNVTAYVNDDAFDTVVITGKPPSTACGTKPNIPSHAYGSLSNAIKFGESIIVYTPHDSDSYLPPEGPYYIQILGRQLLVTSAGCPRKEDGAQVVVLGSTPDSQFVDKLRAMTTYAEVATVTTKGSTEIPVYYTGSRLISAPLCCWGSINVAVGDNNIDVVMYTVTKITQNSAGGQSCCDVTCLDTDTLYIHLDRPLSSIAQAGSSVSVLMDVPDDLSECSSGSAASSLTSVFLLSTLTALPTSKLNALVYETAKRYANFPVHDLDMQAAMYIVPTKKGFTEFNKLCTGNQSFTPPTGSWSVQPDQYSTIKDCSLTKNPSLKGNETICNQLNCKKPNVPPTQLFSFNNNIPANNRWNMPETDLDQVNGPEFLFDYSTVYYFDYSASDLYTGKLFNAKTPQEGDYDQFGNKMKFSGELDFIGTVNTTDKDVKLFPANAPILDFSVTIDANSAVTRELLRTAGTKMGVSLWEGWDKNTVDNFGQIKFTWPDVLPLTLQPGFNYTFYMKITLQPVFDTNILQEVTLSKWVNLTTPSYKMEPAGFIHRNQANVRVKITFDQSTTALNNNIKYTLLDFFLGLGSAIGLMGLGMGFIEIWQSISLPTDDEVAAEKSNGSVEMRETGKREEEEEPEKPNPYFPNGFPTQTPTIPKSTSFVAGQNPPFNA